MLTKQAMASAFNRRYPRLRQGNRIGMNRKAFLAASANSIWALLCYSLGGASTLQDDRSRRPEMSEWGDSSFLPLAPLAQRADPPGQEARRRSGFLYDGSGDRGRAWHRRQTIVRHVIRRASAARSGGKAGDIAASDSLCRATAFDAGGAGNNSDLGPDRVLPCGYSLFRCRCCADCLI
jgi:hypothetical protein